KSFSMQFRALSGQLFDLGQSGFQAHLGVWIRRRAGQGIQLLYPFSELVLVSFELLLTGVELGRVGPLLLLEGLEGAGQSARLGLKSRLLFCEGSRPLIEQVGIDLQLRDVAPVQACELEVLGNLLLGLIEGSLK